MYEQVDSHHSVNYYSKKKKLELTQTAKSVPMAIQIKCYNHTIAC